MNAAPAHRKRFDTAVTVAALGVVFGDIGTSPLYAFKTCFTTAGVDATPANVVGILALIVWALILVVCVKYVGFVMQVDHDGEGGILALLALLLPRKKTTMPARATWITYVVIVGAAMLFGDGVITPAISVISAVEGLNVATSSAQPFIVPLTLVILIGLFGIQSRGTEGVGKLFGPVMVAWFGAIAVAGIIPIVHAPSIIWAVIDPLHALGFLTHHGAAGFLVLGATVLCVTGVEALYADLSHFGRRPIALAWYALVFPALLLNYIGQGARVIADPHALDNPFYALVSGPFLIPAVILATLATVIASQALISGAFTLTEQAIALNLAPRFEVVHTSQRYPGQVYVPAIRMLLGVACAAVVIGFRSSDRLAAAYGLAVAVTMAATSIAYGIVIVRERHWKPAVAYPLVAAFLLMDGAFVVASLPKFAAGGWLPIAISILITLAATTWLEGRRRMAGALAAEAIPVEQFVREKKPARPNAPVAYAVLLTGDPSGVPYVARHRWVRDVLTETPVVLLTLIRQPQPRIVERERVQVEALADGFARVTASFGYLEPPRIDDVVRACAAHGLHIDDPATSFFVAGPKIAPLARGGMPGWRRSLYAALLRVARPLTYDLGFPAEQLIELGVEVRV